MLTRFHFDSGDLHVENIQDVEGILENNKILRDQRQTKTDGLKHVASIPNVVSIKWLNEEYMRGNVSLRMFTPEWDELVTKKLNDPAWRYLRVDR